VIAAFKKATEALAATVEAVQQQMPQCTLHWRAAAVAVIAEFAVAVPSVVVH